MGPYLYEKELLFSALRERRLRFAMVWKKWSIRCIRITSTGELMYIKPALAKEDPLSVKVPKFKKFLLHKIFVSMMTGQLPSLLPFAPAHAPDAQSLGQMLIWTNPPPPRSGCWSSARRWITSSPTSVWSSRTASCRRCWTPSRASPRSTMSITCSKAGYKPPPGNPLGRVHCL